MVVYIPPLSLPPTPPYSPPFPPLQTPSPPSPPLPPPPTHAFSFARPPPHSPPHTHHAPAALQFPPISPTFFLLFTAFCARWFFPSVLSLLLYFTSVPFLFMFSSSIHLISFRSFPLCSAFLYIFCFLFSRFMFLPRSLSFLCFLLRLTYFSIHFCSSPSSNPSVFSSPLSIYSYLFCVSFVLSLPLLLVLFLISLHLLFPYTFFIFFLFLLSLSCHYYFFCFSFFPLFIFPLLLSISSISIVRAFQINRESFQLCDYRFQD